MIPVRGASRPDLVTLDLESVRKARAEEHTHPKSLAAVECATREQVRDHVIPSAELGGRSAKR
jgi:hypothetical protein